MSLEIQTKFNKKKVKVSDLIAEFLKEKKIKHVFGIIGSANSHIFDSINKLKYTMSKLQLWPCKLIIELTASLAPVY